MDIFFTHVIIRRNYWDILATEITEQKKKKKRQMTLFHVQELHGAQNSHIYKMCVHEA